MSETRSHPDRTLRQHLAEIRAAGQRVWRRHGSALAARSAEAVGWFDDMVSFHDTGKGAPQFQAYIPNPAAYRGRREDKAHTPLSYLYALMTEVPAWDWRARLAVAQACQGHHSRFRPLDEMDGYLADKDHLFGKQLPRLDLAALRSAVGVELPALDGSDAIDLVCDAQDELARLGGELRRLPLDEAARYRLLVQLAFSVLLEADKAFLAIPPGDLPRYLRDRDADLPPGAVTALLSKKPDAVVNHIRTEARAALEAHLPDAGPVCTLTLPTGTGKTLLGATWALRQREAVRAATGAYPPVLVVLPFLSVIDQTEKEYRALFPNCESGRLVSYHSLSDRTYPADTESEKAQGFFLDTWQADLILTTFDQLLLALMSEKTRHLMRFHHLADAVIVMDEVQAIPPGLWEPLRQVFGQLVTLGSTRVLAMSATQPGFLPAATELAGEPGAFFGRVGRYAIRPRREDVPFSAFLGECVRRLESEWAGGRVMLVMNTRRAARRLRAALAPVAKALGLPIEFISADVTPKHRLQAVDRIKGGGPCLVVATQCVEAGVDIDLDLVVRDFGPLDSIIQVAGRCNRNGHRARGTVEVVRLLDDERNPERPRAFAGYVYDAVILQETAGILGGATEIREEDIYPLTQRYYAALARKKDTGVAEAESWAYWRETPGVRNLLRGVEQPKVTFVVCSADVDLEADLLAARAIADRWECREALRRLASRIARVSVSVFAHNCTQPGLFGRPFPPNAQPDEEWFWLLDPAHYSAETGIDLGSGAGEAAEPWGVVINFPEGDE